MTLNFRNASVRPKFAPGRGLRASQALLLALALALAALPATAATDKNVKPADPDFSPARVVFDCTARDTLVLEAGFQLTLTDSTTASSSEIDAYGCRQWNERGPENIYRLELDSQIEFFAALRSSTDPEAFPEVDLDIFLLSGCDSDDCLAGENLELSLTLDPGTYYLVVDGYGTDDSNAGHYALVVECREIGLPASICLEGGAEALNPLTNTLTREPNLFGAPNLVQTYDCSPIIEKGGELWFAVTLDGFHEVTVTATPGAESVDLALWLFDTCGPTAACLDFVDDKLSGEPEVLGWRNDQEEPLTVYLACDSYRVVGSEEEGPVVLEFQGISNVPTASTSLGSLRTLFR